MVVKQSLPVCCWWFSDERKFHSVPRQDHDQSWNQECCYWPMTMSSSWLRHRQKQKSQHHQRSASLPRLNQASGSKEDSAVSECGGMAQLRIFNMRQPTNLTGRFPSTVALHAKVEELMIESSHKNPGQQQAEATGSTTRPATAASASEILPNLVQPLSLLPDWR